MSSKWFGYRANTASATRSVAGRGAHRRCARKSDATGKAVRPCTGPPRCRILDQWVTSSGSRISRVTDVASAGGKGANLGELTRAGFPVPPGFVVTAPAYLEAMDAPACARSSPSWPPGSTPTTPPRWRRPATACRSWCARPASRRSCARHPRRVRPARQRPRRRAVVGDGEDTAGASFAGMNETFTNVIGDDALLDRVVDCWASLFGERVVSYRRVPGITDEPAIAVVVQTMVESERSGVMFTADPATGDESRVVIEAAFGLGEVVVGGQVEPDTYVVAKDGPRVLDVRVGAQTHAIVASRRRRPSASSSCRRRAAVGCCATTRSSPWRSSARASKHTTATAGHGVGDRRRQDVSSCSRARSPRSPRARRPHRLRPKPVLLHGLGASSEHGERPGARAAVADGRGRVADRARSSSRR